MIIEKRGAKKFRDIKRGEVFEFNGDVLMKTRDYFNTNAVEIVTGNLYDIDNDAEVIIYNDAKVVLTK